MAAFANVAIAAHVLDDLNEAEEHEERPARLMGRRQDPFRLLTEEKFIKMFRLNKLLVTQLIDIVTPYIQPPRRTSALSVETKVLVALRFYASGSYQEITGSSLFTSVSQCSVSRCVHEVTEAVNRPEIFNEWVHFYENLQELQHARARFHEKYQFPGVVGIIDCTHVAIVRPHGEEYPEHVYVNRKNYHSINVQLICDENLKILNVNSRFPGSCHDSFIWGQSETSHTMEEIYRRNNDNLFYFLGDSGYPNRPWLQTPLREENTPAEERYNARFKSVRSVIERCNGVLKNRFRCLLKHRVLHYMPEVASKIINACTVLHNMCVEYNLPEPDPPHDDGIELDYGMEIQIRPFNERAGVVNPDLARARQIQQIVVANHFNG